METTINQVCGALKPCKKRRLPDGLSPFPVGLIQVEPPQFKFSPRKRGMMNFDEKMNAVNAKQAAEAAYEVRRNDVPPSYGGCASTRRVTLREEAEIRVGHHRQEADKADRAASFFRENPAFDEFIRLIRSGSISI
jgi:hypothetical protein